MKGRTALNNQDQLEQTHLCKEDPCGTNCYAQEHIKMLFVIILNQCSLFSATLTSKMHLTESKKWSNASSRWTFDLSHKQKVISDWFTFMWKWLVLNNHFLVPLSEHFPIESTEHGWVLGQDKNLQRENGAASWFSHEKSLKVKDLKWTQPNQPTTTGTKTHPESQNLYLGKVLFGLEKITESNL